MQLNTLAYQKTLDARKLKLQLEKKAAGKDSNFVAAAFVKDGNEERGINVEERGRQGERKQECNNNRNNNNKHDTLNHS